MLPEVGDERIVEAARRLKGEGLAEPILPLDPQSSPRLAVYAELYGNPRIAQRAVRKPLLHAGMMVKAGDADAMLAGVAHPTARVIEAGLMTIGLAEGIRTPSSFFLMILRRKGSDLFRLRGQRRARTPSSSPTSRLLRRRAAARCSRKSRASRCFRSRPRAAHATPVRRRSYARSRSLEHATRDSRSTASCRPTQLWSIRLQRRR